MFKRITFGNRCKTMMGFGFHEVCGVLKLRENSPRDISRRSIMHIHIDTKTATNLRARKRVFLMTTCDFDRIIAASIVTILCGLSPCAAFAQSQDKTTSATPSNVRPNDQSKTPITQVKKAAPVAVAEPKAATPASPEVHKAQVTRTSVNFQEHFKNGWQMYLQNPNHTGFGSLMAFVPKGNLR